jgi:UDP-2,3-diacylglucosamine pyrophosphatase LpxH
MEKKRIYVSDVHMGAEKNPDCEHDYNWLGQAEADNFAGFLDYLNTQDDVEEIILLGDTMDNWVCPIDQVPPTFDDILNASRNQNIVQNLKNLSINKKAVYMPGNHDMQVTKEVLQKYFPQIIYGGSALNKSSYRTSRLLAEHGSAYAMFNAPDPINDQRSRLPLGYFISRIAATKAARTGDAKRHFWIYIDDLLELLGPQKLPQSVFEAVMEEANIREDAKIIIGTEDRTPKGTPITITAKVVKEKYANLYEQWESHYGKGMAFKSVMAEIGYLGDLADHLSKKGDTNIIIFGHSHDSELDKDSWFVDDRIYANCGAWCDEGKSCSFVETQKDNGGGKYYVRLMKWEQGKAIKVKEESVEL